MPRVAVTAVGAPGTVAGVTAADAADAGPVPTALVAVTVNVYAVPLARPDTVIDAHGAVQLPVKLPGLDVAVYCVIALPPSLAGAAKPTVT
ncbi:MAG: hypothetical protein IPI40_08510 [Betaproteobacteria bacterium]|nr:hypothetical protein [Betaproteobacteria bacterium]MBK7743708.1 hypothetical protein [Betaproteobacteria bacterium]